MPPFLSRFHLTESTYVEKLQSSIEICSAVFWKYGTLARHRHFVRVAEELKAVTEIQFLFIGNGIRRAQAENLAKEKQLSNILC